MNDRQLEDLNSRLAHQDSCIDQLELKIDYLTKTVDELKRGIYQRVDLLEKIVPKLDTQVGFILKFGWILITVTLGEIIVLLFKR